jgi:hypothetical protein|tara:strand:+ start:2425 stop:2538 length:114 start_codon:yes stop_codon:yes gene_type:complete
MWFGENAPASRKPNTAACTSTNEMAISGGSTTNSSAS